MRINVKAAGRVRGDAAGWPGGQAKLPANGQAKPMTHSVDGRQYVVIAAVGYKDSTTRGDYVVACA